MLDQIKSAAACYKSGDFARYFKENMSDIGLETPSSLFNLMQKAATTAGEILGPLHLLSRSMEVGTIIRAGVAIERLGVVIGMHGAWYAGGALGSAIVATGRVGGCGSTIADGVETIAWQIDQAYVSAQLRAAGLLQWQPFLAKHPEIVTRGHPLRSSYGRRAREAAGKR